MNSPPDPLPASPSASFSMPAWRSSKAGGIGFNPSLITLGICLFGFILNCWTAAVNQELRSIDFNQFYASGRLAGTGHLYDWSALRSAELETGAEVPTGRLPVVAYAYKILGSFPHKVARYIWFAGSIAALLVAAWIWPQAPRLLMLVILAGSTPAAMLLYFGQDVPFWLMFFGLGLLLIRKQMPVMAGIAFSLCISKYHLALGIPIMLIAMKNWRALGSAASATIALLAACFLVEGAGWPVQYIHMLQLSRFSPAPQRMPSLYGIASWLPGTTAIEITGAVLTALLLWRFCRNASHIGVAGAAAAACGLLFAHHTYASDCTLLIPLLAFSVYSQGSLFSLQLWTLLLVSPVPALLLGSPIPWLGQILVIGFVITALAAQSFGKNTPGSAASCAQPLGCFRVDSGFTLHVPLRN